MTMRQIKTTEIKSLRNHILKLQGGICPICKEKILDAVLDHEHKKRIGGTGQIRGVLCRKCNVFIAKAENNCIRYGIGLSKLPNVLRNMADYFEKEKFKAIHPSDRPKDPKLKKTSYNKLQKVYDLKSKFPEYPKSGKLTTKLQSLFDFYNIEPEFYK